MGARLIKSKEIVSSLNNYLQGINATYDQSILPFSIAKECYNFDFNQGVLSDGFGLEKKTEFNIENISQLWVYRRYNFSSLSQEYIYMCISNNRVMYYKDNKWMDLGISFSSNITTTNYRLYGEDVIIMCSKNEGMFVWNGEKAPYLVPDAPFITSLCVHHERLFVTVTGQKNAVWFSSDLDPTNWELNLGAGGFIEMPDDDGFVNKVLSFMGYVYIFKSNGISRLSASGAQEDFYLSKLFVCAGNIISDTIALCGDRVLFLSDEGLFCFNGVSTYPLLNNISPLLGSQNAHGVYGNGCYYLSFTFNKGDNKGQKGLLVYDIVNKKYNISLLDVSSFCVGEDIFAVKDGKVYTITHDGRVDGKATTKKWRIPKINWGSNDMKRVKAVEICSNKNITLSLYNDYESKSIEIIGKKEPQKKRVFFSGKRIGIDIVCKDCDCIISGIKIIFDRG